jgi:hypothetical protein
VEQLPQGQRCLGARNQRPAPQVPHERKARRQPRPSRGVGLRLADRGDLANEVIAHKIMALAKAGERDPERLCDGVLTEFADLHRKFDCTEQFGTDRFRIVEYQ